MFSWGSASFLREFKVNFLYGLHLTVMHFGKCYDTYAYIFENFVVFKNFMVGLDKYMKVVVFLSVSTIGCLDDVREFTW